MAQLHNRTAAPQDPPAEARWRLSRTISLDSVIVLVVSIVSGLVFLLTMNNKVENQEKNIATVQKLVERVEIDQKERMSRLERDNAERSVRMERDNAERASRMERDNAERAARLEAAIEKQAQLLQSEMVPRIRR